jgi:hypothetical protein
LVNRRPSQSSETGGRQLRSTWWATCVQRAKTASPTEPEIHAAFDRLAGDLSNGIFVLEGAAFLRFRETVVARVAALQVSTVYPDGQYADEGELMPYGANYADQLRRSPTLPLGAGDGSRVVRADVEGLDCLPLVILN